MKTKLILILVALSLAVGTLQAQTRYYQTDATYRVMTGLFNYKTLQCRIDQSVGIVYVHDISGGVYIDHPLTARNGGVLPEDVVMGKVDIFSGIDAAISRANTIIRSSLSSTSKLLTMNHRLIVYAVFDPLTGRIIEVDFAFNKLSPFSYVKPAEYVEMITDIKNQVTVGITATGKTLNYASKTWFYES